MQLGKYFDRFMAGWRSAGNVKAMFPPNSVISDLTADELARLLGAASVSASGAAVTPETALRVTTVYGCVALIAGAISTLPLQIFERIDQRTRKPVDHDYWWIFNEQANDENSAAASMEYFVSSRLFYGDAFALAIRPSYVSSRVIGWQPLHPSRVWPFWDSEFKTRLYRVTDLRGGVKVYDGSDIMHVPSLGFDGLRSPSPITYAAREAIGTSLAAEEFSARFFSQGSTHDIALKSPKKLNEDQLKVLRDSYVAKYGGGRNARVPLLLSGGLEVEKLSITPQDAALIPTKEFNVAEICRIFGVPPFMVGASDKTTSWGSGMEQLGIAFVKYTLRRHLKPIEQEFNRKLWPSREKFFLEFDTANLERGDFKSRMEGHRIGVGRAGEPGWLTPNDVRRDEGQAPVDGGDTLYNGGNDGKKPAAAAGG